MERRLAAIFTADVVGYSRLIRADEEGTLATLRALRQNLIEPKIAAHHGRIVKLMGDGMLVEFASVLDAVRTAVETQLALAKRNSDLPEDKRIEFRIGINLGDVVIDGDDIHGDGVNVAARWEGLANAGGICISGKVYEEVRDRIDLPFEDLGDQEVKNIDRPVRVWRWPGDASTAALRPDNETKAPPIPDKPSIAVLRFKNLSDDRQQQYFSDGISEDIVTGLSRNPDLLVISRDSTFANPEKPLSVPEIHKRFGAQFVLEGSVRRSGQRTRVTAKLTNAINGFLIWGERYDRDFNDVFAIQDEVVGSILHALGAADGVLEESLRQRSQPSSPGGASAYDCYLQGRAHFYRHGDSGFETAEALFEKAIELDEAFARPYSALAWLHFVRFKLFGTRSFESIRSTAHELAQAALRLDAQDFRAHWVLGGLYLHEGKHRQCLEEFEKALRINPNDANLLAWSAEALVYCGRMEDALDRCEKAFRLNPNCPDWYFWIQGSAYFHLGRYEDALTALERMSAIEHAGRLKAATLAHLGRLQEARYEAEEYMKLVPTFSIKKWAKTEFYADPNELERYLEGQHIAGFPG